MKAVFSRLVNDRFTAPPNRLSALAPVLLELLVAGADRAGMTFLVDLSAAGDRHGIGRHVLGDHAAGNPQPGAELPVLSSREVVDWSSSEWWLYSWNDARGSLAGGAAW